MGPTAEWASRIRLERRTATSCRSADRPRTVAGQQIEVIALVIGQPERAGRRGEDL
ncbi:hypothetical protein ACWEPL_34095 [Nonomuraea sp. NPDC004186]